MGSFNADQKVTSAEFEVLDLTHYSRKQTRIYAASPLAVAWQDLLTVAKTATLVAKVALLQQLSFTRVEETVLVAAAALRVSNQSLWEDARCSSELLFLIDRFSEEKTKQKVIEEAIAVCISANFEDFACGLADAVTAALPQHLIHRAGESGFLQFLLTLYQRKTPVKTNKVIANMPRKVMFLLRRANRNPCPRFTATSRVVELTDVVKWACINGDEKAIRDLVKRRTEEDGAPLVGVLVNEGRCDLLEQLIEENLFDMTPSCMSVLISKRALFLVHKIILKSRPILSFCTPALLNSEEVIEQLIELVETNWGVVALRILMFIHQDDWKYSHVAKLFYALKTIASGANLENNPLVDSCNPLLFAVTASEVCEWICTIHLQYRSCFSMLASEMRDIAVKIQNNYVTYTELKELYVRALYDKVNLFDITTQDSERYRDLLNSTVVRSIVEDLWTGGTHVPFRLSPITPCTWYFDHFHAVGDLFRAHTAFRPDLDMQSLLQIHYWKANGTLRFFVETIGVAVMYTLLCISLILYLGYMKVFENGIVTQEEINSVLNTMKFSRDMTSVLCIISSSYILFYFQKVVYKTFLGEKQSFGLKDFLDWAMLGSSLTIRVLSFNSIFDDYDVETITSILEPLYAMLFFVCSLRICSVLLQLRSFGPILRMIYIIVKDVSYLLIIYLLAIVSFGVLFSPLFRKDSLYFGELQLSIRTLFQWSLGGIDYTVFTNRVELGCILASVWTVLSAIILINILIAVLSSRYETLSTQVIADYVSILYCSYKDTRYEPTYGALILTPAPFNLLTVALLPLFLLFPSRRKQLNSLLVIFSYQVLFFCGSVLWLLYNAAMSFLAYWLVIPRLTRRLRNIIYIPLWMALGPFYLSYLALLSFTYFCRNCYTERETPSGVQLPATVLAPIKHFVETVTAKRPSPCFVTVDDLRAALFTLPQLKTATSSALVDQSPEQSFRSMATERYFANSRLRKEAAIRIWDLMMHFRSFSPDDSHPERINLSRLAYFLRKLEDKTGLLAALYVHFVQKALYLRAEERKTSNGLTLY